MVLLLNVILIGNVNATNTWRVDLYDGGRCPNLLTYRGTTVGCVKAFYEENGVEYPAYCLARDLPGIGDVPGYSVKILTSNMDSLLWRVVSNSYPYKSLEELGVKNIDEAFTATKQAVYCLLYGNDENNFSRYGAIGEAGERTLTLLKKLVTDAKNGKDVKKSTRMNIIPESSKWKIDEIDEYYISKTYQIKADAPFNTYTINKIDYKVPEDIQIVNMNNEVQNTFKYGEKFKVIIPINHKIQNGRYKIEVKADIKTYPIYATDAPIGKQNYVITSNNYEKGNGYLTDNFDINRSKLSIKKVDLENNIPMENVEFNLLDDKKNIIYSNLLTNENGEIQIDGLVPGVYYLKETKTLEGYQILQEELSFEMELNKEVNITVNNNKIKKTEVKIDKEDITAETSKSEENIDVNIKSQEVTENEEVVNKEIKETVDKTETDRKIVKAEKEITILKKLPVTGM